MQAHLRHGDDLVFKLITVFERVLAMNQNILKQERMLPSLEYFIHVKFMSMNSL